MNNPTDTPPPEQPPAVGYGKPPVHSRWRKGQSGNRRGRPKGTKNLATDLQEELAERIPIREGTRVLKASKQRVMLKALIARACKGDSRATTLVVGLMARLLDAHPDTPLPLTTDDGEILAAFLQRASHVLAPEVESTTTPDAPQSTEPKP
jgi:hypothetical protein